MGFVWPVALLAIIAGIIVVLFVVLITLYVRNYRRYGSILPRASARPQVGASSIAQSAIVPAAGSRGVQGVAVAPNSAYLKQVGGAAMIFPLDRPVTVIGRDPSCDIRIAEQFVTVSRRHAQITRQENSYVLSDLNSSGGVYVNEARIGRNRIQDGATIRLGEEVQYTFHVNRA